MRERGSGTTWYSIPNEHRFQQAHIFTIDSNRQGEPVAALLPLPQYELPFSAQLRIPCDNGSSGLIQPLMKKLAKTCARRGCYERETQIT